MRVVLLRVGIDMGEGGINGPLFADGGFEFLPIPDSRGLDDRTYGNTRGRSGRLLVEYFPDRLRSTREVQSMHVDPEFDTCTYGDPTRPKGRLRELQLGDLLVFYAGLSTWPYDHTPAGLYIVGYFEVVVAGVAPSFSEAEIQEHFGRNFHVRHEGLYQKQRATLVLVRGGPGSRLLNKAALISERGSDRSGRPLHVISRPMREVFGDWEGRISLQRSPPRWVDPARTTAAAAFVRSRP